MTTADSAPEHDQESLDFDTVVEQYSDFVYNVAFKMMGKPEDAQDVAQEAFISAFRAFDRFRGESRVTTWLYRITVNAALMRLRKGKSARTLTRTGLEDVARRRLVPRPRTSGHNERAWRQTAGRHREPGAGPQSQRYPTGRSAAFQRGGRRDPGHHRLVAEVPSSQGPGPSPQSPHGIHRSSPLTLHGQRRRVHHVPLSQNPVSHRPAGVKEQSSPRGAHHGPRPPLISPRSA